MILKKIRKTRMKSKTFPEIFGSGIYQFTGKSARGELNVRIPFFPFKKKLNLLVPPGSRLRPWRVSDYH